MTAQPPRSYTGLAVAIAVGALIIGAAVYASSFARTTTTTITRSSTATDTAISTTTICLCPTAPAACPCAATRNITTSSMGGGGTTATSTPSTISASSATASTSNSSDGLQFGMGLKSDGGVNITISVEELNLLDSVNNQTQADQWKYPSGSLNPYDNCDSNLPVGFAILQGYYGMNNYSRAASLYLYNTTQLFSCTINSSPFVYLFAPISDQISVYLEQKPYYNETAAISFAVSGYWTGGEGLSLPATFNPFPAGVYTILGADEWGNVVLLHFTVTGSSSTDSTTNITSTETCTPAITDIQGSNSSMQTTEVITLCHSLSYTQSEGSSSVYTSFTGPPAQSRTSTNSTSASIFS